VAQPDEATATAPLLPPAIALAAIAAIVVGVLDPPVAEHRIALGIIAAGLLHYLFVRAPERICC
jgi:hypothetical protein